MYSLDANIFLRDADQRSTEHILCHTLLQQLHNTEIAIIEPFVVLPEVAGSLSRLYANPMRGRIYADILRSLPHITFVPIDIAVISAAADIAADYALRGMDSIYVAVARLHACTFVTFDREVQQRAGSVVTIQTPAEALAALESNNS